MNLAGGFDDPWDAVVLFKRVTTRISRPRIQNASPLMVGFRAKYGSGATIWKMQK
jgi:hypothetical protein